MHKIQKKQIKNKGAVSAKLYGGDIRKRRRDRTGEIIDEVPESTPAPDEQMVEEIAGVLFGSPAIDLAELHQQYVRLFQIVWNGLTLAQKKALRQVVREGA